MADNLYVRSPDPLSVGGGNPSAAWKKWKLRFDIFLQATGASEKTDTIKVGLLLHHIGDDGLEIYSNFVFLGERPNPDDAANPLPAENRSNYATVLGKFDQYFQQRDPQLMLREQFWLHLQREPGQSFESWQRVVKEKAAACKFGEVDMMVRDKLVFTCRDDTAKLKLYDIGADLTLQKTVEILSMREMTRSELASTKTAAVDVLITRPGNDKRSSLQQRGGQATTTGGQTTPNCGYCNRKHPRGKTNCPAASSRCKKCNKMGHFAVICRSSASIQEVQADEQSDQEEEVDFIGGVQDLSGTDSGWHIKLKIGPQNLTWCIDTGAQVTVMPANIFKPAFGQLQPPDRRLLGPGDQPLMVNGFAYMTLVHGHTQIQEKVYIAKTSKLLLGMPAIQKLGLIHDIPGAFTVRAIRTTPAAGRECSSPRERPDLAAAEPARATFTSTDDVRRQFPRLFSGLGKLEGEQTILLKDNVKPFSQSVPRRVPVPLLKKVETQLDKMVRNGVIAPVDYPTDWCSPIVVVPKTNGDVRICVDLTRLNSSVKREVYAMPAVEETLSKISEGKVFTKLDANSGFHQIQLDDESSKLTTFITPFGRFKFQRLPYGISSAPEYFQKKMDTILQGLDGVVCHMDDILVFGKDKAEHDARLRKVLDRLSQAGLTLNSEKFEFAKTQLEYLGQVIDSSGIRKDPTKVKAIVEMKEPQNTGDVRRFLGMVNQLMKFVPNLADKSKPLRDLLRKDAAWIWGQDQQQAFDILKKDLTSSETLALYHPERDTVISADSSSYGLGAVLLQAQEDGCMKPVAYASRSLTKTERRYAQIEKEALAIVWSLEHWADLLVGKNFQVETDHKPLVPLLSTKLIDELPIRVQRFRMRLLRFGFTIRHVPGKELHTADALSRAPHDTTDLPDGDFTELVEVYLNSVLYTLPASDHRLEQIRAELRKDDILHIVMQYVINGWPDSQQLNKVTKQYKAEAGNLTVHNGLLLKGRRLVIPSSLRHDILIHLHDGHQGIGKTKENASNSVWWPSITKDIELMVKTCPECTKQSKARTEPMKGTPFPDRPWQRIAADFFQYKGKTYLLAIDYYSRDVEITLMPNSTTTEVTIARLKKVFSRHGIPDILITDNGPQFASSDFASFARTWGFDHVTSSPHYPQSNGEVERAVQTIKNLMKKCDDEYLGLLMYRNTPLANGFSPAQLSMGRRLKTRVPCTPESLLPQTPDSGILKRKEKVYREKMTVDYNRRHSVVAPEDLSPGVKVWVPDLQKQGTIVQQHEAPRSFIIKTSDGGLVRRNRQMTRKMHLPHDPLTLNTPPIHGALMPVPHSPSFPDARPSPHTSPVLWAPNPPDPGESRPVGGERPTTPLQGLQGPVEAPAQGQLDLPSTQLAAPALQMPTTPLQGRQGPAEAPTQSRPDLPSTQLAAPVRRPTRNRRTPAYLKDYDR